MISFADVIKVFESFEIPKNVAFRNFELIYALKKDRKSELNIENVKCTLADGIKLLGPLS